MLPRTTLFLLTSLDGKLSTGADDFFDMDRDLSRIPETAKGLQQYYALEKQTDNWSFNTGRVLAKVGWNEAPLFSKNAALTFAVYDNKHLTLSGITNLANSLAYLYIITTNPEHPVVNAKLLNVRYLLLPKVDMREAFEWLYAQGCERLTVQSGGEMNSLLLRHELIKYVLVVIAPVIVGGRNVTSVCDGEPIRNLEDLAPLRLIKHHALCESYMALRYIVTNASEDIL